jgi:uncharacterized protein YndB with AHSA1/START domain
MNQNAAASPAGKQQVFHATFSIERTYPQAPARVFFAHANEAMKRRWMAEGEGWEVFEFKVDFRVGGTETSRFSFQGGPEITYDASFQDIVENERIVLVYRMAFAGKPMSVSLATVELVPAGSGTRLTYTEQGAYFDDPNAAKGREEGWRGLLEKLAAELQSSK